MDHLLKAATLVLALAKTSRMTPRRQIVRREVVSRGYKVVPGFGSVDRSYVRLHLDCGHTAEYFPSQAPRKFVRCLDCEAEDQRRADG